MKKDRLLECIKSKKIKHSGAREAIYKILQESQGCLKVEEIAKRLIEYYPKKISINTIYRHLNLFVDCGLALVIQDDFKRAYYTLKKENEIMVFRVCLGCNGVKLIEINQALICDDFKETEFITLHKRCSKCKK